MNYKYNFTEIFKLKDMLDKANIDYVFRNGTKENGDYTDYHIWIYDEDEMVISVIQNWGSYGRDKDLLEIMGLLTDEEQKEDSVVGWLTAENVFKRIQKYYLEKEGR